jgi:hypothetical protein
MSSDTENFDQLRRLMTLKRYEQPPPGYFDRFSGEVISRIRAGQEAKDITEVLKPAPWLLRLLRLMEGRPAFASAFGVIVCALLIGGVIYSEQVQPTPLPVTALGAPVVAAAALGNEDAEPTGKMQLFASTNSSAVEARMLFEQIQFKSTPPATPASFAMPVGN